MLDYKETIQSAYNFLKRSEEEHKHPFAYEIYLLVGADETALTPRASGSDSFLKDIEGAVEKAKHAHGILKVKTYGGKSHNAKYLNAYTINVSGSLHAAPTIVHKDQMQQYVQEEVQKMRAESSGANLGLGGINGLIGLVQDEKTRKEIEGLFGMFNTLSGNSKEAERFNYQKQLDDFKYETRYSMLQEKCEKLSNENTELRIERDQFNSENKELKKEKADLEGRLAGYAPNELMKRVAVGVISGIGGKILSNSPKTAELLGLTPQELKGALGIVEESNEESDFSPTSNVEVNEIGDTLSPEDKKKAAIIKNLSEALMTWDLEEVAKIANIIGLCLDKAELINKTLLFLNQSQEATDINESH